MNTHCEADAKYCRKVHDLAANAAAILKGEPIAALESSSSSTDALEIREQLEIVVKQRAVPYSAMSHRSLKTGGDVERYYDGFQDAAAWILALIRTAQSKAGGEKA